MVWLLLGALVVYFAAAGWFLHRRWARDPEAYLGSDSAGVRGLGEAPATRTTGWGHRDARPDDVEVLG